MLEREEQGDIHSKTVVKSLQGWVLQLLISVLMTLIALHSVRLYVPYCAYGPWHDT